MRADGKRKWKILLCSLFTVISSFLIPMYGKASGLDGYGYYPEKTAETKTETCLYSAPVSSSAVLTHVPEGTRADILTDNRTGLEFYWLVRVGDSLGYIAKNDVELVSYLGEQKVPAQAVQSLPFIELSGNLWENSYSELMNYYMMIPESIRQSFQAEGFRIIMREEDITREAYADYGGYTGVGIVEAVSDYEKKVIYVQDEYPRQIIHEMGHYVNNKWGFSRKPGFAELAASEADKISIYASNSVKQSPNEFFCEVFDLYIRDPQALQAISPASFAEMAADLASLQ